MIVEELVTKLGLEVDSTALATLEKFRAAVVNGLSGMNIAAVAAGGAILGMVHAVASAGDEIQNTSEKIGVSTQALQELKFAADQSDVTFDSLATGLKFLGKNAGEAAKGSKEALEAFAGISLRDAAGKLKTPDELLMSAVETFGAMKDPVLQTQKAMKLFGRSGTDLLPMLKKSKAELGAFMQDAHDLGVILDDETIEASGRFDQQLKRLRDSFKGLRNAFAAPFVGRFADMMEAAANGIKLARPFFRALSMAVADVGDRFAGMLGVVRRTFTAFSEWFSQTTLGKILAQVDGFKYLEAALIGLGVVFIATGLRAVAAWALAAAPFILLGMLIGFIVDELYNFIEGNDSLLGRLQKWADAIGPADEHPIVKVLRLGLSLLLDLSDPKKWDAFKDAAGKAFDWVAEKAKAKFAEVRKAIRDALLGPESVTTQEGTQTFEDFTQVGQIKRALGIGAAPLLRPSTPALSSVSPEVSRLYQQAEQDRAGIVQNLNVTVNGAGMTPEQAEAMVRRVVNEANAAAFAAVSGGEH